MIWKLGHPNPKLLLKFSMAGLRLFSVMEQNSGDQNHVTK